MNSRSIECKGTIGLIYQSNVETSTDPSAQINLMIKLRWALFVTYILIQSITSSEMCSLHLTHPTAHTLGAVGSRSSNPQPWVTSGFKSNALSTRPWLPEFIKAKLNGIGLTSLSFDIKMFPFLPCNIWLQNYYLWCKQGFVLHLCSNIHVKYYPSHAQKCLFRGHCALILQWTL